MSYAIALSAVKKIIRIVEVTPLPEAPEIVLGVINVHGDIIPVFNVRKRFHLPEHDIQLSEQLIIASTLTRTVALLVDAVCEVAEIPEQKIIMSGNILPELAYVEGVVKTEDGMIIIHDLEKFLSLQEGKALNKAMETLIQDERKE